MNVVVDTWVIIAVIAGEPERDELIELTRGADLLAPHSVHWEIGSALSAMLKRNGISLPLALKTIAAYRRIPIRFVDVELDESLRIAGALGVYAHDAYLIRSGIKYRAPLVTLDSHLVKSAKQIKADVIEVSRERAGRVAV